MCRYIYTASSSPANSPYYIHAYSTHVYILHHEHNGSWFQAFHIHACIYIYFISECRRTWKAWAEITRGRPKIDGLVGGPPYRLLPPVGLPCVVSRDLSSQAFHVLKHNPSKIPHVFLKCITRECGRPGTEATIAHGATVVSKLFQGQ